MHYPFDHRGDKQIGPKAKTFGYSEDVEVELYVPNVIS